MKTLLRIFSVALVVFAVLPLFAPAAVFQIMDATSLRGKRIATTAPANGNLLVYVASTGKWTPANIVTSPADGQVLLANAAGTDFNWLYFGGTTSTFPALKRNAQSLELKLADDSVWARLHASSVVTHSTTGMNFFNGGSGSSFAGLKQFGNATALRLTNDTVPAFASLTACAAGGEGGLSPVSDSTTATWGDTITGGGANHVLAYCNGTNWTVAAK
jgi:hypothetical protein